MKEIVFLLEEPSAQCMLEGLLPKLLPQGITVRYIVFEGKQDLDKQLPRRLRGYRVSNAHFVILRDQDSSDCIQLKRELQQKCIDAGKINTLVRIACHELENWYIADLKAVESALQITGLAVQQKQAKYRAPDRLSNAALELEKLTKGAYQKISGSRAIGPLLETENTTSKSFSVFVEGVRKVVSLI
jgi:hypothetical protein